MKHEIQRQTKSTTWEIKNKNQLRLIKFSRNSPYVTADFRGWLKVYKHTEGQNGQQRVDSAKSAHKYHKPVGYTLLGLCAFFIYKAFQGKKKADY